MYDQVTALTSARMRRDATDRGRVERLANLILLARTYELQTISVAGLVVTLLSHRWRGLAAHAAARKRIDCF
jgi:hypothetical protein